MCIQHFVSPNFFLIANFIYISTTTLEMYLEPKWTVGSLRRFEKQRSEFPGLETKQSKGQGSFGSDWHVEEN